MPLFAGTIQLLKFLRLVHRPSSNLFCGRQLSEQGSLYGRKKNYMGHNIIRFPSIIITYYRYYNKLSFLLNIKIKLKKIIGRDYKNFLEKITAKKTLITLLYKDILNLLIV